MNEQFSLDDIYIYAGFSCNKFQSIKLNYYLMEQRCLQHKEEFNFAFSKLIRDLKFTTSEAKILIQKFIDLGILSFVYKSDKKELPSIIKFNLGDAEYV